MPEVAGPGDALAGILLARHGETNDNIPPIRVQGFTDTPLMQASIANIVAKTGRTAEQARSDLARTNPQGRLIDPKEVADAVLWLASEGAGSVTGQAVVIAGGEVMAG